LTSHAEGQHLAKDVRRLAGDIASVFDGSPLVDLLESLAGALETGQLSEVHVSAERLRDALAEDETSRRPRARAFWR
jgi:hypothetical protein